MRPQEKPSKGLVSRMRQLRGGGENQEDEEMKILNTSKQFFFTYIYIYKDIGA